MPGRDQDPSSGHDQHDLPELLSGLEPLVGGGDLGERVGPVDVHARAARADEVVRAEEVLARAHRRAQHVQLLPPEAMELRGRVRPAGRAADDDPPCRPHGSERARPRRLADRLDDDVDALAGRLLDRSDDVAVLVVDREVGAPARARSRASRRCPT